VIREYRALMPSTTLPSATASGSVADGGVRAPGGLRRLQSGWDGRSPSGGFDSRPPPPTTASPRRLTTGPPPQPSERHSTASPTRPARSPGVASFANSPSIQANNHDHTTATNNAGRCELELPIEPQQRPNDSSASAPPLLRHPILDRGHPGVIRRARSASWIRSESDPGYSPIPPTP
jgi:hypothetical protein